LLAFDGDLAVGWCQLTPRHDLRWLNRKPDFEAVDDTPVWSISCFYVRRGYRRKGVMSALIVEALKTVKSSNAPALEHIQSTVGSRAARPTCSQVQLPHSGASDLGPSLAASPLDQSCATT